MPPTVSLPYQVVPWYDGETPADCLDRVVPHPSGLKYRLERLLPHPYPDDGTDVLWWAVARLTEAP